MSTKRGGLNVLRKPNTSEPKKSSGSGGGFDPGEGRITEHITGDVRDAAFWRANIVNSFLDFGYYPTEAEVAQLIPTSSGEGGYERGKSSVANYVEAQRAALDRKENDPLKGFSENQQTLSDTQRAESGDLFQKAMDIYKQAPQLFGGLQPDQIEQYLAPTREAARTGLADTEGAFGRRGLAGSNIEANAMAEQNRLYQQNVLAQALGLGIDQQTKQASLLSGRSSQLLGAAEGAEGRLMGATGQLSGQAFEESQFLASLPMYLRQLAMQERQMQEMSNGTDWGGIGSLAGTVLGGGAGFLLGGPMGAVYGAGLGGSLGGGIGNTASGNYGAAAGNAQQIPLWMLLGQGRGGSSTTGTNTTPSFGSNLNLYPRVAGGAPLLMGGR